MVDETRWSWCAPSQGNQADSRCDGRQGADVKSKQEWDNAWEDASRRQKLGVVTASIGGAMLIGGIVWAVLDKKERSVAVSPRLDIPGAAVHVEF